jgi:sucrose-6-phosphate hydrolase SacC (GH32 family)
MIWKYWLFLTLACLCGIDSKAENELTTNPVAKRAELYKEKCRPQFHFTARYWDDYRLNPHNHEEGWLNDMNGLIHNQGEYHLFAQRWWSAWLHAISTDLIHWEELRPAFGKGGKFGGTQSGGGVVDFNNCSGLGDGKEPPMIAFWSSTDNLNQCISYSRDKGRTWTKYEKNPVLVHAFRDPNVFWYEPGQKWILIMYGPSDAPIRQHSMYGFNGEENDAHNLRDFKAGEWSCSVVRVFEDGRVVATDPQGQSEGSIDAKRQKLAAEVARVGAKADGSEFLEGDVAEILVYDRPLSDNETKGAIDSLQNQWKLNNEGVASRLPTEGMVLHLKASEAESNRDGVVSLWKDASGKGHDMKQSKADRMPKRVANGLGGRPVVHFEGSQFLQGNAVLAEGDNSFTLAALWRRKHASGSEVVFEQNASKRQAGARASLLTVSREEIENCYLLFSSTNLLDWKKLDSRIPDSFECPDMFELPVDGGASKWVVVDGNGDYVTGSFDGSTFTTETKKRKGDYGRNFYATMTFHNMPKSDPRRVQLAWMRGWDDYPKDMPFNQQVSFPCELTLRKLAQGIVLCRYPIREIDAIHGKEFRIADRVLKPGENLLSGISGELFDIELKIDTARSSCSVITLKIRGNTVKYDLKKGILHSHGSEARLDPISGMVEIRVLVDRLSLEAFGNRGEVSITNIAKQASEGPHLVLSAQGGDAVIQSLVVHELESIWKDVKK